MILPSLPHRIPRRRPVRSFAGYRARLSALVRRHPWLERHIVLPAPGHLGLFETLVVEIEMLLPDEIETRLSYFHVRPGPEGSVVFYDYEDPAYARREVVRSLRDDFVRESTSVCALCGAVWLSPKDRHTGPCAEHPYTPTNVFEVLRSLGRSGAWPSPTALDGGDDPAGAGLAPANVGSDEKACGPTVHLYNIEELDRLAPSGAQANRGKDDQRLRRIAEQVRAAGSCERPLAVLKEDPERLLDRFAATFPNFAEFTEFLRDQFALVGLGDWRLAWPPVLLVGNPGIGKTEVARWLADELGTPFRVIDMATAQSNSPLVGSDAFWTNTREGGVFEALAYGPKANPLIVLDELDKANQGDRYNAIDALYTLLEPRSAERFMDLSVRDLAIDASHILWVATANRLDPIPAPIRSRFTVFDIPDPTPDERGRIAAAIYIGLRARHSWGGEFAEALTEDVIECLSGLEPRSVARVLKRAFGRAARAGRRQIRAEDVSALAPASGSAFGFLSSTDRPALLAWP